MALRISSGVSLRSTSCTPGMPLTRAPVVIVELHLVPSKLCANLTKVSGRLLRQLVRRSHAQQDLPAVGLGGVDKHALRLRNVHQLPAVRTILVGDQGEDSPAQHGMLQHRADGRSGHTRSDNRDRQVELRPVELHHAGIRWGPERPQRGGRWRPRGGRGGGHRAGGREADLRERRRVDGGARQRAGGYDAEQAEWSAHMLGVEAGRQASRDCCDKVVVRISKDRKSA